MPLRVSCRKGLSNLFFFLYDRSYRKKEKIILMFSGDAEKPHDTRH